MALSSESQKLLTAIRTLHQELRADTFKQYKRINPFSEDLFEWKERGRFWSGEDKNITIYNSTIVIGDVDIGTNTWIGPHCALDGNGGLTIGSHCSISSGVQIVTHDTVKWALSKGKEAYEYAPIKIGDCCFIGTYAVVTKGVSIGSHSLVAAGAVVTRDFPDYSIIAGIPARLIGKVDFHADGTVNLTYFKNENRITDF